MNLLTDACRSGTASHSAAAPGKVSSKGAASTLFGSAGMVLSTRNSRRSGYAISLSGICCREDPAARAKCSTRLRQIGAPKQLRPRLLRQAPMVRKNETRRAATPDALRYLAQLTDDVGLRYGLMTSMSTA